MTKKNGILILIVAILVSGFSVAIYKVAMHNKIERQNEKRFDHFMSYWYPILDQYTSDMEMYARMKKGIILDYIERHEGRYIDENVQLFGGGYFPLRAAFNIGQELEYPWISLEASYPIRYGPDSRMNERGAFNEILRCGQQLRDIDEYDEKLGYDSKYLEDVFNRIDSLAHVAHINFVQLEKYRPAHNGLPNLNNIPDEEYSLENY